MVIPFLTGDLSLSFTTISDFKPSCQVKRPSISYRYGNDFTLWPFLYINSSFIVHDSFTFHLLTAMISGDFLVTRFVIVFLLHIVSKHRKTLSSVQTSVSITSRFLNRLAL